MLIQTNLPGCLRGWLKIVLKFQRRKNNGKNIVFGKKDKDPFIFVLLKKALIITYYWPPSGGGGVQRWLKFVKYLREFGWEPVIYKPKNPDFELKDESLLDDVPSNLEVLERPIWEPYSAYRKLLGGKAVQQQGVVDASSKSWLSRLSVWVRGNYFIPDSRVFWVRPSVQFLSRRLKRGDIDMVITTGPPHSVHLIGLELKKRLGIKWVADFRDPWSEWDVLDQLNLSKRSRKNHTKLERSVLTAANLVLTVSPTLQQSLEELGAKNTKLITNGFDTEIEQQDESRPEKFRIAHIGLLNKGRNPEDLWQVLNKICQEQDDFCNDLEIYLAGTVELEVIQSLNRFEQLTGKAKNVGYRSHMDVLDDYSKSSLLLLLVNNTANAKWILPGKMFEYMGQGKPILTLGAPQSDASAVLEDAGYNKCLSYDDKDSIEKEVLSAYNGFKINDKSNLTTNLKKYHRKELTRALASCLDSLE